MFRRLILIKTDNSKERISRIGVLGTTLGLSSNGSTRRKYESNGITSQKTAFFIVTAVKASNLTEH
jgi:hypothetical protein